MTENQNNIVALDDELLAGADVDALAAGDDGNGFAAVTAKREQDCVHLFILGDDVPDDVFLPFQRLGQIQVIRLPFYQLA